MAVKAGQPQVQCDKQVSARTYVAAAGPTCWQEDTLQHVWDERVNSSALKEKSDISGNVPIFFLEESTMGRLMPP